MGGISGGDMPMPSLVGNQYQKFELSLPFARTDINAFVKRIRGAAQLTKKIKPRGNGKIVTIEALREALCTPAWEDLKKENSRITKLIKSSVFENENGEISVDYLLLFGFLNCPGEIDDKSNVLYEILQEGGPDTHKCLSAQDKDMVPTFNKLFKLASSELVQLMKEVDGVEPTEVEGRAEDIDETLDEVREDNYLDPIYGFEARLDFKEWQERSRKPVTSKIFYEVNNLRNLIFTRAGISFPESNKFTNMCAENEIATG